MWRILRVITKFQFNDDGQMDSISGNHCDRRDFQINMLADKEKELGRKGEKQSGTNDSGRWKRFPAIEVMRIYRRTIEGQSQPNWEGLLLAENRPVDGRKKVRLMKKIRGDARH